MVKDGESIEYTVEASDYSGHEKNITENAKDGFFVTYTHELFAGLKKIPTIIYLKKWIDMAKYNTVSDFDAVRERSLVSN